MDDPRALFDLSGTVSVVTGGGRGIGRSIAIGLAGAGSDLVLASRKIENCRSVADLIIERTGRRVLPVAFHVGHWEESEQLVDTVYGEFGRCDVLVNNAGISPPYEDLPLVTEELWTKTHDVNAKGPFRLSTLFAARMFDAGGGSIINVSSGASRSPRSDNVVYAMSKGGLDTLTLGLIARYGPKVRVNTLYPGVIETDMLGAWESRDEFIEETGIETVGQPDDFVGAAVFLASAASRFTTGAELPVA